MHTNMIHHPVVACLPCEIFKAWVQMLCLAKEGNGVIPKVSEVAFHLRCGLNSAIKWTDALVNDYSLLERVDNGTFRPKNWDKHQYKSDVSTERVRTFRKRKGNVSETPPESDTESDTESEQSREQKPLRAALAPSVDAESTIRRLAEDCPDQQDFETGVDCAVRALMSSANPATTLRTMQDNLPLWWAAMRSGNARVKPMRFVIVDKDYLRPPADAIEKKKRPHWSD